MLHLQTKDSIVQEDMDCFINSLNSLYGEKCQFTFGTITQTNPSNDVKRNAKWFNKSCKTARRKFHNAKYRYKLRKTDGNKHDLNLCSKAYKKTLSDAQTKFKNSKIKEMQNIKSSNPRIFWKFLNQTKKKPPVNLTVNSAYEHFKKYES